MDNTFNFLFVQRDIELDEMAVAYSPTRQVASLQKTQTLQQQQQQQQKLQESVTRKSVRKEKRAQVEQAIAQEYILI